MKKIVFTALTLLAAGTNIYANDACTSISPNRDGSPGSVYVSSADNQHLRVSLWYNPMHGDGVSGGMEVSANGRTSNVEITDSHCNNGRLVLNWHDYGNQMAGSMHAVISQDGHVITNVSGWSRFNNQNRDLNNNFVFSNYTSGGNSHPNPHPFPHPSH